MTDKVENQSQVSRENSVSIEVEVEVEETLNAASRSTSPKKTLFIFILS